MSQDQDREGCVLEKRKMNDINTVTFDPALKSSEQDCVGDKDNAFPFVPDSYAALPTNTRFLQDQKA
jgi:hypothetical protein